MIKDRIKKIIKYLNEDIWRVQTYDTTRRQFFTIKTIRILFLSVKGYINDQCSLKASALTLYSLLSFVPIVAMIFGIAKGFGFEEILREIFDRNLSDPNQQEIINWIIEFAVKYLENTPSGQIAGIGLVVLVWSVMKVLGNIESTFNDIWKVKRSRSFIRKFTDYMALMFVAIIFMISTSGMVVFISNQMKGFGILEHSTSLMVMLSPYILVWLAFTFLLYIMPNKRVKFTAALFGGFISGTMFQLLQYGYIHSQVWLSKYNAIYGSFAALPLFLIWLQLSWLIVMYGAELSFAFQNYKSFEFDADIKRISYRYKRLVYLLITHFVVKNFENGDKPCTSMDLSVALRLPLRLVNDLVFELVESNVFIEVNIDDNDDVSYQPAIDINKLTITRIVNMVEDRGSEDIHFEETDELRHLRKIFSDFDKILENSDDNILLKDL